MGDQANGKGFSSLLRLLFLSHSIASIQDDLKTVSLTTSKVNYIDPRLTGLFESLSFLSKRRLTQQTVAWCKRSDVPIDKIFTKSLRQKFVWAMDADPDWEF